MHPILKSPTPGCLLAKDAVSLMLSQGFPLLLAFNIAKRLFLQDRAEVLYLMEHFADELVADLTSHLD